MSQCAKIRVADDRLLDGVQDTTSSEYYFELPLNFDLRQTKQITELTSVDKLKFDYTLGFELDATDQNMSLINHFLNPNIVGNRYDAIPIIIELESCVLTDNSIYVVNATKDKINVQLKLGLSHWAVGAPQLFLCDLPYNTVEHTCDHIKDVIENQYPYDFNAPMNDPNNLGVWYPWGDYGRLVRDKTLNPQVGNYVVPAEYWRPWYYLADLLRKGFCELGFEFKSPLFESEFGRRLLMYTIDPTYGQDSLLTNNIGAEADVQTFYPLAFPLSANTRGTIRFPNIISDPTSGFVDPVRGLFVGVGEFNISGQVLLTAAADVDLKFYFIRACYINGTWDFNPIIILDEVEVAATQSNQVTYEFNLECVTLNCLEGVGVMVVRGDTSTIIAVDPGSSINFEGTRHYAQEGDIQDLGAILNCNVSFMDLLKSVSHTFNLKIKTDFVNQCVELYIPFKEEFGDEEIEGFFLEEVIEDISALIDPKSCRVSPPDRNIERYQCIGYKESEDSYIEQLNLSRELWSIVYDLGPEFTAGGQNDNKNPLIEPTVNRMRTFGRGSTPHIPVVRNEKPYGFPDTIRIGLAFGNVVQDQGGSLRYCKWDDDTADLIPTVSMYAPIALGENHNDPNSPLSVMDDNLIYGLNSEVNDYQTQSPLFDKVYLRDLEESLNNLDMNMLVDLCKADFRAIDFRKYYCFQYMNRLVTARMQKVNDFHYCSNLLTPVDFIPLKEIEKECPCVLVFESSFEATNVQIESTPGEILAFFDTVNQAPNDPLYSWLTSLFFSCIGFPTPLGGTLILEIIDGNDTYNFVIAGGNIINSVVFRFTNIDLDGACDVGVTSDEISLGTGDYTINAKCYSR